MTYTAFISYSHAADDKLANGLQRALHGFAKPWYKLRALRIFRDKSNLSANPDLWEAIERALRDSQFFILLASPEAARSKWVKKEIAFWKAEKPAGTLLLVLTDGELSWDANRRDFDWEKTTAVPGSLAGHFIEEPLWVDMRPNKSEEQLSLRSASFRTNVADLAAPLHGKNKDELDGDDLREHRRTMRVAGLAAAGLVILLCAAVVGGWVANEQRKLRMLQRQIAVARLLTAESESTLGPDMAARENSALLAVESLRQFDLLAMRSLEADRAVRSALAIFAESPFAFDFGRSVNDVAFGPDGETIVAASVYTGPKRWQLRGRNTVPTWQREERVRHVALSADGGYLATAVYHPRGLEVWVEPVDSTESATARRHLGEQPIAVSPSGRYLALGSMDRRDTQLIDVNSGEVVERLPAAQQVVFSRDGRYVAIAAIRNTQVWELGSDNPGERLRSVELHRSPPGSIAFSADSRYLAIRDRDEDQILVLDLNGDEVARLPAMRDPGRSMALSAGAQYLAIARLNDVIVQDVVTGASLLLPYGQAIAQLAFDADTSRLAVAGLARDVIGWQISKLSQQITIKPAGGVEALHISESPPLLTALIRDTSAASGLLASRQYRFAGSTVTHEDVMHGSGPAVLSGNARFVAATGDGHIKIWNLETRQEETPISDARFTSAVAISDDGRYVAVLDQSGTVQVLDRASGETSSDSKTPLNDIAVTLGPIGRYMVGNTTRTVGDGRGRRVEATRHVWDLHDRHEVPDLVFTGRNIPRIVVDPSGSFVALDEPVTENLATKARESSRGIVRPIVLDSPGSGFPYTGAFLTFSPDGNHFVTKADDGALRVWDRQSRREIARLPKGPDVTVAALSSSARYLAVLRDNAIQVWMLAPADLRLQSCQVLARKALGPVIWRRYWDTDPYEETCPAHGQTMD